MDASLLQPHLRAYAEHGWKGFSADVKASLCKVGSKVALQKWFYAQTKRQRGTGPGNFCVRMLMLRAGLNRTCANLNDGI